MYIKQWVFKGCLIVMGALSGLSVQAQSIDTYTKVSAGATSTCALTQAGKVRCWGNNSSGQLGNGTTTNSSLPIELTALGSGNKDIAVGGTAACVVTHEDTVKCWGNNAYGQLGNGSTASSTTPVSVCAYVDCAQGELFSDAVAISAGYSHFCAMHATAFNNNRISCWGRNNYGQLGNSLYEELYYSYPVLVSQTNDTNTSSIDGFTAVEVGDGYSCGILGSEGYVLCWGRNTEGQLGNKTRTNGANANPGFVCAGASSSSCSEDPLSDVVQLAAGKSTSTEYGNVAHTCVRLRDTTMKCWGSNFYGQLGTGSYTIEGQNADKSAPTDVCSSVVDSVCTPLNHVSNIAAGTNHTCATLDSTGQMHCWGANYIMQIGNGVTPQYGQEEGFFYVLPQPALGLFQNAATVSAGAYHSCAITDSAGLYCWGYNSTGQLGNNTLVSSAEPVYVSAQTPVLTLSLASSSSSAIYGVSPVLTATIGGGDAPDGFIAFYDITDRQNPVVVCNNVPINDSNIASCQLTGARLDVGNYTYVASYNGDVNNAAINSLSLAQSISIASTSLKLTVSSNPVHESTDFVLTGTLTGGDGPTGTISFRNEANSNDPILHCRGVPVENDGPTVANNGVATCTVNADDLGGEGSYSITAYYEGDQNHLYSYSNAPLTLSVVPSSQTLLDFGGTIIDAVKALSGTSFDTLSVKMNGTSTTQLTTSLNNPVDVFFVAPPDSTNSPTALFQVGADTYASSISTTVSVLNVPSSVTLKGNGVAGVYSIKAWVCSHASGDASDRLFCDSTDYNILTFSMENTP